MELWLSVIGAALGIVYLILKRRRPKTPLEKANETTKKHDKRRGRLAWLLRKRKLKEFDELVDDQSRELRAVRSVRREKHKANRQKGAKPNRRKVRVRKSKPS